MGAAQLVTLSVNPKEETMDKPIKKILAKEGLIIIGVVVVGFILIQIGRNLVRNLDSTGDSIALIGFWIIPSYLIIRLILWVIKKLKEK